MFLDLTFTSGVYREITQRPRPEDAVYPAALSVHADAHELLISEASIESGRRSAGSLQVVACARADGFDQWQSLAQAMHPTAAAFVTFGIGDAAGRVAAHTGRPFGTQSIRNITIVAPRLPILSLHPLPTSNQGTDDRVAAERMFSRTIGALGHEGDFHHLANLSIGIVGCGRLGSMLLTSAARLGVRNLTVVDDDVIESHCAEMDGPTHRQGVSKVQALSEEVCERFPHCAILPLNESVTSWPALVALKGCQVLLCAAADATARLATAVLAKLYLKPLIDVGSGIFHTDSGRVMGADVRLVLPDRCLSCFGGITDEADARRRLLDGSTTNHRLEDSEAWRRQRVGSLRSLNHCAAGFALRLLEDYIAGRLADTHLRLEFSEAGLPSLISVPHPVHPSCDLCEMTGMGDDGVRALPTCWPASAVV